MVHAARPPLWQRIERFLRRNTFVVSAVVASCTLLVLMAAMLLSRPDGKLHVWLLDIGHSNATLMQTPGGAHILVDGGRYPSRLLTALGDRLPYYDRKLEILAITHPDEWDIAALESVLERYSVGAALYHGQKNDGDVFGRIMDRLARSDTPLVEARAGYRLELDDGVRIEVLHPKAKPRVTDKLNDHALVLRVSYGDVSFLLTSDLSSEGQREMLARGISPVAAVMQIPQHGAVRALDDEFLKLAQPQVALLQSDVSNRRGDPDPDTLSLFEGIPLFRTDEMGTIHLFTDGETLHVVGSK
jgi:competence protein ComEC